MAPPSCGAPYGPETTRRQKAISSDRKNLEHTVEEQHAVAGIELYAPFQTDEAVGRCAFDDVSLRGHVAQRLRR